MSITSEIGEYLKSQPKFRERRFKDRGIVNLLMRRRPLLKRAVDEGTLTKEELTEIVQEYASMDRAWRQALEFDPTLRGTDYAEKQILEEKTQLKLGYTPGHEADKKKLETL